jgi:predicted RNA-binding Zn-ribbon protein involved in translation (DUF1610 family)
MTLEESFIDKISYQLSNFKRNHNSWQFRCPYCQAGSHHRTGRPWKNSDFRAYFYREQNATNFKCHKCGKHTQFHQFLKDHFPAQFIEYVRERELMGTTGFQTNCPTLDKALLDTGKIKSEKPDFSSRKEQQQSQPAKSEPSQTPQQSSPSESCGNAPKKQVLPPMRSPQQQAGHQARLNRLIKEKQERDRKRRGELW